MGAEPDIAAFTEASEGLGAWLLLAELDHRVRNELAAAAAALRLARHRRQAAAQPSELIDAAIERLENFCQVQHLLERHHNHGPLGQRLEALCRAIAKSKGAPQGVQIVVGSDDVMTDDETAWTVCAVACELMTNAFRHAFHGASRCALAVSLREERDWLLLTVADNGIGFAPRDIRPILSNPGLGSAIVTALAERLGGAVTRRSEPDWTAVTLRLPANARAFDPATFSSAMVVEGVCAAQRAHVRETPGVRPAAGGGI